MGREHHVRGSVYLLTIPIDVMVQANNLIDKWGNDKGWDGHHLYDLMSKTTTIRTEFRCITFEEFAIREGSYPTALWLEMVYTTTRQQDDTRVWSKLENDMEAD